MIGKKRCALPWLFPFPTDGESILAVAAGFKTRLLAALEHNLGIENIRNIEIDVRKGRPKPGFY